MEKRVVDCCIIGGGPAGMAAAVSLKEEGIDNMLILERDSFLGGILNQCIHHGFGLHLFKEELTGPEYAQRFIDQVKDLEIPHLLNTMALEIKKDNTIYAMNKEGLLEIQAKTIILAMGSRERARGAIETPGDRPAGVYLAGMAQQLINMEGYMPGKEIVIIGSGDIGLIMARRMALEGAKVKLVAEIAPYSSGLKRNIVQCLDDYNIPLELSTAVVDIKGRNRVESVITQKVDENWAPIPGTEKEISCDTVLLSVGLIPENELSRNLHLRMDEITGGPLVGCDYMTDQEGVYSCGNVLHIHDVVDFVSEEAEIAGKNAARYIKTGQIPSKDCVKIREGEGISYIVPDYISKDQLGEEIILRFRVRDVFENKKIIIEAEGKEIYNKGRRSLNPSEMEHITLQLEDLEDGVEEITVRVGEK